MGTIVNKPQPFSEDQMMELMEQRGYSLGSRTTDRTAFYFINEKNDLHAEVIKVDSEKDGWKVKLLFLYKLYKASSNFFQFTHTRFSDLFEKDLLLMKEGINYMDTNKIIKDNHEG